MYLIYIIYLIIFILYIYYIITFKLTEHSHDIRFINRHRQYGLIKQLSFNCDLCKINFVVCND